MEELLKEMGPVESSSEGGEKPAEPQKEKPHDGVNRLFRIKEDGYFAGVCAGLAAYLNIDPTVVRITFVLLTLFTSGAWILAYALLMFILPPARTEEQKAAAFGEPFTAKDWVKNAREHYEKLADHGNWRAWKSELRQKRREERREQRRYSNLHGGFRPFRIIMGLVLAALSLVWFYGLISLISTGAISGVSIPATMPAWTAVLIWCCLYAFLALPLRTVRYKAYCEGTDAPVHIHLHGGFLEGAVRIALWAVLAWALWQYVPASHLYFQKFIAWGEHFRNALINS